MQTETATATDEPTQETWDGTPVPMERWGKDHCRALIYIESRNVDGNGQPEMQRMRTKSGSLRRGTDTGHVTPRSKDYPTILADGQLHGHDDWDCVDDLVHAGLVLWEGTGTHPVLRLTSAGWTLAGAARRHLAETNAAGCRTWAGFDPCTHVTPPPSAETLAKAKAEVIGGEWTKEQLEDVVATMRRLNSGFYGACFTAGMGSSCHPFLEFNGIISKYIDLCQRAAHFELPFPVANTHSGVELPMAEHDVEYFAEKFACIFGPWFRNHPEMADFFCDRLILGKDGH